MIRVIIADDHAVVRHGLRFLLEQQSDIEVVAECANGQETKDSVFKYLPDVLLLDLIMPEIDGVDVIQSVSRLAPNTQIIVLTSFHDDDLIFRSIQAGALSYLLKDVAAPDLVAAIRAAVRGECILHPLIARRVLRELRKKKAPARLHKLTTRETDVLKCIARGRTNHNIAVELMISEETVKSHVSSILSKLRLVDRTQAAIYALQQGLVALDDALKPDD